MPTFVKRLGILCFASMFLIGYAFATEAPAFSGDFVGKIGKRSIKANLTRDGISLFGYYGDNVDSRTSYLPKKIWVDGLVRDKDDVVLRSYPETDKNRQVFKAKLSKANGHWQLKGTWRRGEQADQAFTLKQFNLPFARGVHFENKTQKYKNQTLNANIEIHYFQLAGKRLNAKQKAFNQQVQSVIKKIESDFAKDLELSPPSKLSQPNNLTVKSDIMFNKPRLISIRFVQSVFITGRLRSFVKTQSLNFDVRRGRTLKLSNVFKNGSHYLKTLSTSSYDTLLKRIDDADSTTNKQSSPLRLEVLKKGTAPEPKNFAAWNLTPQGLMITFDPSKVAAASLGPQLVVIPYQDLKLMLRRQYRRVL
jgi:Protein of unknown function (DUF3298)